MAATPQSPEKAMSQDSFSYPARVFPQAIRAGKRPFMIMEIRDSVVNGPVISTIALPLPKVKSTYSANYQTTTLGVLGGEFGDLYGVVKQNVIGAASDLTGLNLKEMYDYKRRMVRNTHQVNLFESMGFREFSFSWRLSAQNQAESDDIQDIIFQLKHAAHPDIADSQMFKFPDVFVIGLYAPAQDYLFRISTSALRTVDVDYTPNAVPSFFKNSQAPVSVDLTLDFLELEILTKDRIKQGY